MKSVFEPLGLLWSLGMDSHCSSPDVPSTAGACLRAFIVWSLLGGELEDLLVLHLP